MRSATITFLAVGLMFSAAAAHGQTKFDRWGRPIESKPTPLALGGFCVVSLRDHQQWRLGAEAISAEVDGRRYQFPTARERDVFLAATLSYLPMLQGDCPITFAETGHREPGRLDCGLLRGSRLIFFRGEDERRRFQDDPSQFIDADLVDGGQCVVTRQEKGREVAGIPETAAIHNGLRYFFASAHDRALFLRNPARYDGSKVREGPILNEGPIAQDGGPGNASPWTGFVKSVESAAKAAGDEQGVLLGAVPAMTGYCPVSLRRDGAWVRGRYDYRVELGSVMFLTAGPQERDALLNDPATFVPALGGDCVVSYVEDAERVRGSVYHAYEYEGRLFLFADAKRKTKFKAQPANYANVDVAFNGQCAVTRIDENREASGIVDQSTWFAGKLYRFAGAEQKNKFLADPARYAQP